MASSASSPSRFDHGVSLFDAGAFFEAHEAWEDLWREALGEEKRWLQGWIQVAAAFVHYERGFFASGFSRLLDEGREKIVGYSGDTRHLDVPRCLEVLEPWFEHGRRVASGARLREDAPGPLPRLVYEAGYTARAARS